MSHRQRCEGCKEEFYADDEFDIVDGSYYCSYCQPKLVTCELCGNYKLSDGKKRLFIKKYNKGANEYGFICSGCRHKYLGHGSVYQMMRFKVFRRDSFTCRYCGASPLKNINTTLQCDHIFAHARGGKTVLDNLVTACASCNSGKWASEFNEEEIMSVVSRKVRDGNCI